MGLAIAAMTISQAIQVLLNMIAIAAVVSAVGLWSQAIVRWKRESRSAFVGLVPARSRNQPFWTLLDAMIMFGTHLVLIASLHGLLIRSGWIADPSQTQAPIDPTKSQLGNVLLVVVAGLGSSCLVLIWLRLIDPNPIRRLGLIPNPADAWLGVKAAVMLLPPVLVISALVNQIWPYEHQVLDLLQTVDSIAVFAAMFIATAIVTPFVEELLFRVLIQGGMQGMLDRDIGHRPNHAGDWSPQSYLPMVIASVLFALMHVGQGAAPIPLFFLSLGLGYLYRQTGNITAPMVVHMILNGFTLIAKFTETAGP